jgi:hypothetical protein
MNVFVTTSDWYNPLIPDLPICSIAFGRRSSR